MCGVEGKQYAQFISRYHEGEWRARIFRDMVVEDITKIENPVVLDIGCGSGFDDDVNIQTTIAAVSSIFIGVEPDVVMPVAPVVDKVYRCLFEEADIQSSSVDLAYSVMVMEHLKEPQLFWDKLHSVLKPGGIYWGFTMDARHWFVLASMAFDLMGIKDIYLNRVHRMPSGERYENYPVYYRSNTPSAIRKMTGCFSHIDIINLQKVGQISCYYPPFLRGLSRIIDRIERTMGFVGTVLMVRAVK